MLEEGLSRLEKLIDKILAIPKLEQGKMELNHRPLNLTEFFTNFHKTQLPIMAQYKIQLLLANEMEKQDHSILADKFELQRVFENLLSNTLRFVAKDGTGKVILKLELSDCGKIRISVSDNGCGIPAEKKTVIFEKF